jgi:N4-gp56 family major capsid protein
MRGESDFRPLGSLITIPKGNGIKARIPNWTTAVKLSNGVALLSAGTQNSVVQLTEATAITPGTLSAASITGQVSAFGDAKAYTDKLVMTSMASFTEAALKEMAHVLALRIDGATRRMISGGAYKVQADFSPTSATTANKVRGAAVLFGKNVAKLKPIMASHMLPQWEDGSYVGVAHPLAQFDMMRDISASGFISIARYNHAVKLFRGEIGELYGVRWLLSNSVPRFLEDGSTSAATGLSGTVSGANAYVFSPNSFYNLELATGGVEVIHQPLGSGGATGDPVGQIGSVGCKVYFGVIPTPSAERRIVRFVHNVTLRLI